jgi:hypothetical protein
MTMHEASRTLVKSTPELWAECSDSESLSRHLGAFGEIRITKLEPETAVAWEGEDVRGTVTLEPSGWGTRVVLTATAEGQEGDEAPEAAAGPESVLPAEPEPVLPAEPEPEAAAEPEPTPEPGAELEPRRQGLIARLFGFRRRWPVEPSRVGEEDPEPKADLTAEAAAESEPEAIVPPEGAPSARDLRRTPEPEVDSAPAPELEALVDALESLGSAHRRPFSRS